MKSRNTRSQMSKISAAPTPHSATCTKCDKPINKTQHGPDFCQHEKYTSSTHRAFTNSKRPARNQPHPRTCLDSQLNIPLIRSRKSERTKNLNIPSDQVDSLAISVVDSTRSESNKDKEIVIIDSSHEEEDSQKHYYAGHQSKNPSRKDKFTLYKGNVYILNIYMYEHILKLSPGNRLSVLL